MVSTCTSCMCLADGPDPHPLLLSHGWPGSVFEFLELIPRLTDPERFGEDPSRRVYGRCALPAWLRPVVHAGPGAVWD